MEKRYESEDVREEGQGRGIKIGRDIKRRNRRDEMKRERKG